MSGFQISSEAERTRKSNLTSIVQVSISFDQSCYQQICIKQRVCTGLRGPMTSEVIGFEDLKLNSVTSITLLIVFCAQMVRLGPWHKSSAVTFTASGSIEYEPWAIDQRWLRPLIKSDKSQIWPGSGPCMLRAAFRVARRFACCLALYFAILYFAIHAIIAFPQCHTLLSACSCHVMSAKSV